MLSGESCLGYVFLHVPKLLLRGTAHTGNERGREPCPNARQCGSFGCSIAAVIGSQCEPRDGGFEFGKVVCDRGRDDRV